MLSVPASLLEGRRRVVLDCSGDPSRTKQSFAQECDINHIVARFEKTGVVTHLNRVQGTYADVSEMGSYREALDIVRAVQNDFSKLPSAVREQFGNDPASFIDRLQSMSPQEVQELIYGPLRAEDPVPAPEVPPTAPEGS